MSKEHMPHLELPSAEAVRSVVLLAVLTVAGVVVNNGCAQPNANRVPENRDPYARDIPLDALADFRQTAQIRPPHVGDAGMQKGH